MIWSKERVTSTYIYSSTAYLHSYKYILRLNTYIDVRSTSHLQQQQWSAIDDGIHTYITQLNKMKFYSFISKTSDCVRLYIQGQQNECDCCTFIFIFFLRGGSCRV